MADQSDGIGPFSHRMRIRRVRGRVRVKVRVRVRVRVTVVYPKMDDTPK